jgi:hypothetical protein
VSPAAKTARWIGLFLAAALAVAASLIFLAFHGNDCHGVPSGDPWRCGTSATLIGVLALVLSLSTLAVTVACAFVADRQRRARLGLLASVSLTLALLVLLVLFTR